MINKSKEQLLIEEELKINPKDYKLYEELGDYLKNTNKYQSYLCYENGAFFCGNSNERIRLLKKKDEMGAEGYKVPKSAMVILNYNLRQITEDCIESIRETTPESAREIIIIDNASEDDSIEYLDRQKDIKLQKNKENAGFPGGCNQGIVLAEKDSDIFLLNNDTIMCENSLFWLRMGLYEDKDVGAVGSVSNYVSNEQKVIEDKLPIEEYRSFALKNNVPMDNPYENKCFLVGFAVMIKRTVLEEIGYLDEKFFPGHFEDTDLGFRITLAGYKNVLVYNSFIVHLGSKTFGKTYFGGKVMVNNRAYFNKKYGEKADEIKEIRRSIISISSLLNKYPKGSDILEMNCSIGTTLLSLKRKFPDLNFWGLGTDSKTALFSNRNNGVNVRYCDNLKGVSVLNKKFDAVIFETEKIDKSELDDYMAAMRDVLKPEGVIYLSVKNVKYFANWLPIIMEGKVTEAFERSFITEKDVLESVESNSCVVKNWYFIYSKSLDEKIVDLTSEISKRYQEERKDEINISTIWMEISRK